MAIPESLIQVLQTSRAKALLYQRTDPELSLMHGRKFVEGLLRCAMHHLGLQPTKHAGFNDLWEKPLKEWRQKYLNRSIETWFTGFNLTGNDVWHETTCSRACGKNASGYGHKVIKGLSDWSVSFFALQPWSEPEQETAPIPGLPEIAPDDLAGLLKDLHRRSSIYAEAADYESGLMLRRKMVDIAFPPPSSWKGQPGKDAYQESAWKTPPLEEIKIKLARISSHGRIAAHAHDQEEDFAGLFHSIEDDFQDFCTWTRQDLARCANEAAVAQQQQELARLANEAALAQQQQELARLANEAAVAQQQQELALAAVPLAAAGDVLALLDRQLQREKILDCWHYRLPSSDKRVFLLLPGFPAGGQKRFLNFAIDILRVVRSESTPVCQLRLNVDSESQAAELGHLLSEALEGKRHTGTDLGPHLRERLTSTTRGQALLVHYHCTMPTMPLKIISEIVKAWQGYLPDPVPRPVIVAFTWPLPVKTWNPIQFYHRNRSLKCLQEFAPSGWQVARLPDFEYFQTQDIVDFLTGKKGSELRLSRPEAERLAQEVKPTLNPPDNVYDLLEVKLRNAHISSGRN